VEREGLGPNQEVVLALQRELADRTAELERAQDQFLLSYYRDYELSLETKNILERQLEEDEDEFRNLSRVKLQYDEQTAYIERDKAEADRHNVLYEKLLSRSNESFDPVTVAERADQPFAPFKPDKRLNMILASIFGLLGGLGIAFFLEYMDDTVKTKEELQRITEAPLLGVIPHISARRTEVAKKDLFAYNQPKSTISEAFRGVRTAISYSAKGKESRVFLVTSSGPKEGKTTIVINIATVMAYSGTRTLLIDADLRKPRIHKSFDLNNSRGLTNLIIGDGVAEDLIQSTGHDRLDVLSSGPIPPNPSELLGTPRMVEILEELGTKYDRILIDTPPIGAVTDAAVVGQIVDAVLLVVHAGKTRRKLIERGLEQLAQINVPITGVILNNLKIGQKRYYPGYYHYYYYYSSYYGADKRQKSKAKEKSRV
jgi:polysaccharide biosynthesis transport protein